MSGNIKVEFRAWLVCLFLLLASSLTNGENASPRGGPLRSNESILQKYQAYLEDGHIQQGLTYVLRFASQKRRNKSDRLALYRELTDYASSQDDQDLFWQLIKRFQKRDEAFGHYVLLHHFNYAPAKKPVVDSLIWLANHDSRLLDGVRVKFIWDVERFVTDSYPSKYFDFSDSLFRFGFPREYSSYSLEHIYLDLILEYLSRGNVDYASQIMDESISSLKSYFVIWHDLRYKALWNRLEDSGPFDPEKIVNDHLKTALAYLNNDEEKTWTEWIGVKSQVMSLYRSIGQFEDAIAFGIKAVDEVPESIRDESEYFWLKQELALSYKDSGLWSMYESMIAPLILPENEKNQFFISGMINHSIALLEQGELTRAEQLSKLILGQYASLSNDFGKSFAKFVQICSLSGQNKKNKVKELYNNLLNKAANNNHATMRAAICMRDESTISKLYIQRLSEPDDRASTLTALSRYSETYTSVYLGSTLEFRDEVIKQPKIQKDIKKYGRIGRWNLPRYYWDSF